MFFFRFAGGGETGHAPAPEEHAVMLGHNNDSTLLGKRARTWHGVASRWGVRGRSEHREMMGWMFHFWTGHAAQRKMVGNGYDKKGVFKNSSFHNQKQLPAAEGQME